MSWERVCCPRGLKTSDCGYTGILEDLSMGENISYVVQDPEMPWENEEPAAMITVIMMFRGFPRPE